MTHSFQPTFDTVSQALTWLSDQGFTHDFNLDNDCIRYNNGQESMSPKDFNIEYFFRFEGETDPGDESIVYAINSDTYGIKGVMVNAFGTYADSISAEMIQKLAMR